MTDTPPPLTEAQRENVKDLLRGDGWHPDDWAAIAAALARLAYTERRVEELEAALEGRIALWDAQAQREGALAAFSHYDRGWARGWALAHQRCADDLRGALLGDFVVPLARHRQNE